MKNETIQRLQGLSQRMGAVVTAAAGRELIPPQKSEIASVSSELVTLGDEVRSSDQARHAYDKAIEALADDDHRTANTYLTELTRLHTVHLRMQEVDEVRGQFGSLFNQDDAMERTSGGGPTLATLFDQYRKGNGAEVRADLPLSQPFMQTRDLSTPGGTAIATTFADRVVVYERTLNPMLNPNVVTISTSPSGAPFKVPRLTADVSFGGTVTAEAVALTEADPTISAVELTPYKYGGITLWSAELDQDEILGIQDLIARSHAREIAIDAGAALTTGNGSGKPNGIITAATNGGTASKAFGGTATTFFDYGDLVSLFMAVPAPSRAEGVWQMSTDAIEKCLTFRTDDGDRVLLPGLLGTGQLTLMGKPIYENPAMASVGSASKSVVFGDHSAYWVRRVAPLRVELSTHYKFNVDQVALKVVDRLDGDLIDVTAVAYLVSADA